MSIPLPNLLRQHREDEFNQGMTPLAKRWGIRTWSWLALHPRSYRLLGRVVSGVLKLVSRQGRITRLPGLGNWTDSRDMPSPQGQTFMQQWQQKNNGEKS